MGFCNIVLKMMQLIYPGVYNILYLLMVLALYCSVVSYHESDKGFQILDQ